MIQKHINIRCTPRRRRKFNIQQCFNCQQDTALQQISVPLQLSHISINSLALMYHTFFLSLPCRLASQKHCEGLVPLEAFRVICSPVFLAPFPAPNVRDYSVFFGSLHFFPALSSITCSASSDSLF